MAQGLIHGKASQIKACGSAAVPLLQRAAANAKQKEIGSHATYQNGGWLLSYFKVFLKGEKLPKTAKLRG